MMMVIITTSGSSEGRVMAIMITMMRACNDGSVINDESVMAWENEGNDDDDNDVSQ